MPSAKTDREREGELSAIWSALHEVVDPEVGIDVVELGLVYGVFVEGDHAHVTMTMTTPSCPLGSVITRDAVDAIRRHVPELRGVEVAIVWEPPWTASRMSDEARRVLGFA